MNTIRLGLCIVAYDGRYLSQSTEQPCYFFVWICIPESLSGTTNQSINRGDMSAVSTDALLFIATDWLIHWSIDWSPMPIAKSMLFYGWFSSIGGIFELSRFVCLWLLVVPNKETVLDSCCCWCIRFEFFWKNFAWIPRLRQMTMIVIFTRQIKTLTSHNFWLDIHFRPRFFFLQ